MAKKKSSNVVKQSASVVTGMMKMSAAERKRMQEYQAEEDVRTLSRAHEIKRDKGRIGAVEKHLRRQSDAVGKALK